MDRAHDPAAAASAQPLTVMLCAAAAAISAESLSTQPHATLTKLQSKQLSFSIVGGMFIVVGFVCC